MQRRNFIKQSAFGLAACGISRSAFSSEGKQESLIILHTNDVHSRIDPFPMDGGRNQGLGGVLPRMKMINEIRAQNEHVLLLDAGDIFQGTPYFNFFKGEPEIKAMSSMGYDAATMGNHDFDGGIDNFTKQLEHANFPILISNYNFKGTSLNDHTKAYKIFKKGRLKIGVFGLGIALEGLVPKALYQTTQYMEPLPVANEVADHLRKHEKCDLIICLSHLGYDYGNSQKISDVKLAALTKNIDLIIGGHSHTFLTTPTVIMNQENRQVIINQVGWGGIYLGRIDIDFASVNKRNFFSPNNLMVGKKN